MALRIEENKPLKSMTTFRMGGCARYFAVVESIEELSTLAQFAQEHDAPLFVLGGGSNTIASDEHVLPYTVAQMKITGIEVVREVDHKVVIQVGAGERWDDVVSFAVDHGLAGIEAMSAIPGSMGATPIQNVGAYGQDISQVLNSVTVFNTKTRAIELLTNDECAFGYRDSIFKKESNKHLIIVSVTMILSKEAPLVPEYPGVKAYFDERGILHPTLKDIRTAIIAIRQTKLPDPKHTASAGSFFKNPIVASHVALELKKKNERAVVFDQGNGTYKIGAGFLIDSVGLKGKSFGNLSLYEHNALVIVNNGSATFHELEELILYITGAVKEQFGIVLEPEPIFVK